MQSEIVMKRFLTVLAISLLLGVGSLVQASESGHRFTKQDVRECGDLSTVVANVSGPIAFVTAVQNGALPIITVTQAAGNYFIAKFQACTCLRAMTARLNYTGLNGCFIKAYNAATLYKQIISQDVMLSDLTIDDIEGMF